MKVYSFDIDKWQCNYFLHPIRSKVDVINLWMMSIKYALTYNKLHDGKVSGKIFLVKRSMNRLFFFSEKKCFSVNFPFNFHCDGDVFFFNTHTTIEVGNKESSEIISILNSDKIMDYNDIYESFEEMITYSETSDEIWPLFRYLMMQEDGYVRYDNDPENENGNFHPVNHLDVCYSNSATFKIGIYSEPDFNILKDILDCETDCHFLKRPNLTPLK